MRVRPVGKIEKVRVLIAEDQAMIREGLATLLAQQNDDFEISRVPPMASKPSSLRAATGPMSS